MAGSPARKEVARVGVKVVPDTSEFGRQLEAELAKWANRTITISVDADTTRAAAKINRLLRNRRITINVDADTKRAEERINRAARDRKTKVNLDVSSTDLVLLDRLTRREEKVIEIDLDAYAAQAELEMFELPSSKVIRLELESAAARAELEALTRSKEIEVRVESAAARAEIALLTRPESKTINIDVDRVSLSNTAGMLAGFLETLFGILGRVGGAVGVVGEMFDRLGRFSGQVFSGIGNAATTLSGRILQIGAAALTSSSFILRMVGLAGAIVGIVALLGSVISAAGAAVVSLGSVVLAGIGLGVLPQIFATVANQIIGQNKALKKAFGELQSEIDAKIEKAALPVIAQLFASMALVNQALSEGSPLFVELSGAFAKAADALDPLYKGLLGLGYNVLVGVNDALDKLLKSAYFEKLATGFIEIGDAIGQFVSKLADYSKDIGDGFLAIADAFKRLLPAFADLMGEFSKFAPTIITGIAEAFARLFEAFASNREIYERAADALAQALVDLADPLEKAFAVFAKMAPDLMSSFVDAFDRLVQTISDPATLDGLIKFTQALIDLTEKAAEAAVHISSKVGRELDNFATGLDRIAGVIKDGSNISIEHLKNLVKQADSTREAATNLQRQWKVTTGWIEAEALMKLTDLGDRWQNVIDKMVDAGQDGAAKVNQAFRDQLQELVLQIMRSGEGLNEKWRGELNKLIQATAESGDENARQWASNMQEILNTMATGTAELEQKYRTALLQLEDRTEALRIAELLGIELEQANASMQRGVQDAENTFKSLPHAMQVIINTSKTPEEMRKKLSEMNKVIDEAATQGGKAFSKLPKEMEKGLKESATLKSSMKKVMDDIKDEITSGTQVSVSAWRQFVKDLGSEISKDTAIRSNINSLMGDVHQEFDTGVKNSLEEWAKLFREAAQYAENDRTPDIVGESMKTVYGHVQKNTDDSVDQFRYFSMESAKYGRLIEFQDNLSSALDASLQVVTGKVNAIIEQFARLNSVTISPKVSVQSSGGGGGGSAQAQSFDGPQKFSLMALAEPMTLEVAEPVTLAAESLPETASAAAITTLAAGVRSFAETTKTGGAAGGPTKIYDIDIHAAPNVPTEEQLRRQLSYADALYG